jgi:hypothetical protein
MNGLRAGTLPSMGSLPRLVGRAAVPFLGLALLSGVGSCDLPKPQIPSIGAVPAVRPDVAPGVGPALTLAVTSGAGRAEACDAAVPQPRIAGARTPA